LKLTAGAKDAAASANKKSNAPVVGGAVGSAIAALSTQITDAAWRNLVTVSAPIIAVSVTAIWGAIVQLVKSEWTNFTQRYHTRTATKHYRELLSDPSQPQEVRERAEKAMINAQIATIEFHEKNLNLMSTVDIPSGRKNQGRRAAGSKNAEVQKADLPKSA
jgi:hypothetical protein